MSPAEKTQDTCLDQPWGRRKRLTLALRDGELCVTWRDGGDESNWQIPTACLDENTSEIWTRRRGLLICSLIILGVAGIMALAFLADVRRNPGEWPIVTWPALIALPGVGLLVGWLRVWDHKILLFDGRDGQQVLTVQGDVPSREAVQTFLDGVLAEARRHWQRIEEDALASAAALHTASEIRGFHGLRVRGVITTEEFECKKRELLDAFTRR